MRHPLKHLRVFMMILRCQRGFGSETVPGLLMTGLGIYAVYKTVDPTKESLGTAGRAMKSQAGVLENGLGTGAGKGLGGGGSGFDIGAVTGAVGGIVSGISNAGSQWQAVSQGINDVQGSVNGVQGSGGGAQGGGAQGSVNGKDVANKNPANVVKP